MKSVQGMTLFGALFLILFVIVIAILGTNLVPPYIDHFTVKDSLESIAKDPSIDHTNKNKMIDILERRLQTNSVKNIPTKQLEIEQHEGKQWLVLNYEIRVPLIGNIDAVVKFNEQVGLSENR